MKMKMSQSFSLSLSTFFFLSLLLNFHGSVNGDDIVSDTCKKAAASDPQLKFDFCVSSLQANPKSKIADLLGLGVISMELSSSNATYIRSYIGKLLKDGQGVDPRAKKNLQDCLELYSNAIVDVQYAIIALKARDFMEANTQMSAAMDASTTCEDGFKEDKGLVSPLAKEDNDFFQLTAISLAITNLVK
ncbi:Pectinesterase inhibitor domain [Macleaya cordata]|uniref:Pectinesterase inhibitor domain n=1 Tax=Macleaya cordata TaxID=56857 RepID=A0A200PLU4_MACCD|nr:Pectinesterase inhibitor domain [Macleaya cordata]